jgi:hypothetical protein
MTMEIRLANSRGRTRIGNLGEVAMPKAYQRAAMLPTNGSDY